MRFGTSNNVRRITCRSEVVRHGSWHLPPIPCFSPGQQCITLARLCLQQLYNYSKEVTRPPDRIAGPVARHCQG